MDSRNILSNVKKATGQISAPLKQKFREVKSKIRKAVTGSSTIRVRDHVKSYEHKPPYIKFFDKLSFTLSVLNICATEYFVIADPSKYYLWYSIILPIMLIGRYKHFKENKLEYFLLDFCYTVNVYSLFQVIIMYGVNFLLGVPRLSSWLGIGLSDNLTSTLTAFTTQMMEYKEYFFTPYVNEKIFKLGFIITTGPLPLSTVVWKFSLVFHDFDKVVSVLVHILPSLLYYCLKYDESLVAGNGDINGTLSLSDYVNACLYYLTWQSIYLVKTEWWDKEKLENEENNLQTSLKWMTTNTKIAVSRAVLKLCKKMGLFAQNEPFKPKTWKTKMVFVSGQIVFTLISFLPTYHSYIYPGVHLAYMGIIFSICVFYGASYYVEVFSTRYTLALEKAAEKAVNLHRSSRSNSNAHLPSLGWKATSGNPSDSNTPTFSQLSPTNSFNMNEKSLRMSNLSSSSINETGEEVHTNIDTAAGNSNRNSSVTMMSEEDSRILHEKLDRLASSSFDDNDTENSDMDDNPNSDFIHTDGEEEDEEGSYEFHSDDEMYEEYGDDMFVFAPQDIDYLLVIDD